MSGKQLLIEVTSCNVKKLDLKAYNVDKQQSQVVLKVNGEEKKTTVGLGLDPKWEEHFTFDITDENTTKCSASFIMGSEETRHQIGDEQEYLINTLITGKPTYKAIIVPGGKVEMMFTAKGFGKEEEVADTSAFMSLMDDDMGMIMDDE
eukprot:CAMPEP_0202857254 /NCGR_PEP_ID=MMETSP1391-20130828/267_1 /ASSEMBLY_ACC=CAM_ASM_000867 /TAXON_ID=1034604 /ORGANISM="Chlamydomonas leiostraca, Strain SAG 11-49" /LENGTH=148 /DNA_ID=CAMNT_0049536037 /DNA_START=57 /DNA_END=503 /DNA_ORIENTATION=-